MKRLKSKIFSDHFNVASLENNLNAFLETLDYDQIEDVKFSSSQIGNYVGNYATNLAILVTYTEEE